MAIPCANHPQIDAVTKCTTCSKPICPQCMIYREGTVYCSEGCAIRMKTLAKKIHDKVEVPVGPPLIPRILRLLIMAAIVIALLEYFHITNWLTFI